MIYIVISVKVEHVFHVVQLGDLSFRHMHEGLEWSGGLGGLEKSRLSVRERQGFRHRSGIKLDPGWS